MAPRTGVQSSPVRYTSAGAGRLQLRNKLRRQTRRELGTQSVGPSSRRDSSAANTDDIQYEPWKVSADDQVPSHDALGGMWADRGGPCDSACTGAPRHFASPCSSSGLIARACSGRALSSTRPANSRRGTRSGGGFAWARRRDGFAGTRSAHWLAGIASLHRRHLGLQAACLLSAVRVVWRLRVLYADAGRERG
jgi:hypothetical protein